MCAVQFFVVRECLRSNDSFNFPLAIFVTVINMLLPSLMAAAATVVLLVVVVVVVIVYFLAVQNSFMAFGKQNSAIITYFT